MISTPTISETERILLEYLGESLKSSDNACEIPELSNEEWERIYSIADRHEVSVLMGDIFNSVNLSDKTQNDFQLKTARTVHKGIRLQAINTRLTSLLEKEGIRAVTLKGYAVARLYPVPEFRKTTDIDSFALHPDAIWAFEHRAKFFEEHNEKKLAKIAWNALYNCYVRDSIQSQGRSDHIIKTFAKGKRVGLKTRLEVILYNTSPTLYRKCLDIKYALEKATRKNR